MTDDQEAAWWTGLTGDDITLNTEGCPPYDVKRVADLINDRLAAASGSVLDLGCGTGRLTDAYAAVAPGVDVVGVDVAPRMLLRAQARCPHATFSHDLPDGPLAGAYSVTVLQHLIHSESARLTAAVAERLARSARFCFQYVEGVEDAFVSHQADVATVTAWCENAGLTVEAVEHDAIYGEWRWVTAVRP